ncbi:MAG: hypothetical protein OWQ50_00950 [Acidianus infernus]|nr:hypothetical protein [Acidianus infernus]
MEGLEIKLSFSDYWRIDVRGKRVLDIEEGIEDSPIFHCRSERGGRSRQ